MACMLCMLCMVDQCHSATTWCHETAIRSRVSVRAMARWRCAYRDRLPMPSVIRPACLSQASSRYTHTDVRRAEYFRALDAQKRVYRVEKSGGRENSGAGARISPRCRFISAGWLPVAKPSIDPYRTGRLTVRCRTPHTPSRHVGV
ncbi:hypothetical protein GGS23DRAFT_550939 [Durotheca rogersii]|uniref:uncharacterized protein n=1 Tax=Durotheca rogersii TaxID=419775 RepID=UPI00221ED2B0|nr:uncharacterized protein GGS23DRAFT_550939 [Durotheca rogersii]KAI5866513.1 hypothetical protein GGS23DRAFT_550939 [Durotheca rogersii]